MKFIFLLTVLAVIAVTPFVLLRKPWALRLWRNARLVLFAYVIAMVLISAVWLITRWDSLYG